MPVNIMSAAVVPYQNRFYIIGGYYLDSEVVRDNPTSFVQYFQVDSSLICAGGTDSTNCWLCSDGTYYDKVNKTCVNAQPGYFIEDPGTDPQPCIPGEFSSDIAATSAMSCIPCNEGTYARTSGTPECVKCPTDKYCPFRASIPEDPLSKAVPSNYNEQPEPYRDQHVPVEEFISFGATILFTIVFVILLVILKRISMNARRDKILEPDDVKRIQEAITVHDPLRRGADGNKLFLILTDLGVTSLTEGETYETVKMYDADGMGVLFDHQIMEVCIAHILAERLEFGHPVPEVSKPVMKLANFSFKKMDKFDTAHNNTGPGEPVKKTKNDAGGIMSIAHYLIGAIFAVLIITTFTYENIAETRSSLPAVVAQRQAFANIQIRVSTAGDQDRTNCVTDQNECIPGMVIQESGFDEGNGNSYSRWCEFVQPRYCVAYWECKNCSVRSVKASVDVVFFEEDWFSTLTEVHIVASSGVPEEVPAKSQRYVSSPINTVFLGYPATEFVAEVTQTLTKAPYSTWDQRTYEKSGYHVRFLDGLITTGNIAINSEFPHIYRVPVRVSLQESEGVLLISRFAKSPVVDLVSGVIGGVAGLAGLFIICMNLLDKATVAYRKRRTKQEMERLGIKERVEGEGVDGDLSDEVLISPRSVGRYLRGMLQASLTYKQAKAILDTMRVVHNERRKQSLMQINSGNGPAHGENSPTMNSEFTAPPGSVHEAET
jgi:hypothetical protein